MLLIFSTVVFYWWLNYKLTDWLIDWFTELFPQARRWWQRGSCGSRWTRCRRWWCSHARSHFPHLSGLVSRIRIGANTKGATLDNRSGESGKSNNNTELIVMLNCLPDTQLKKEDETGDITRDWKFAAMVVDRLCLIIFTLFTIIATLAVLFSAPHFIVSMRAK